MINPSEGDALQHRTYGVGRRIEVNGLLIKYDRHARLASTLTSGGLRVCCCSVGGGEKTTLRPHPIGTKMEVGIYHWLWRCTTSTIKIDNWGGFMETGRDWAYQRP